MMKKITEANDSWDGMFPVNINKKAIPIIDTKSLYSEQELFGVYNISAPKSLEILGSVLISGLIEHYNPAAPVNALQQVRVMFNRIGYDFSITNDRLTVLKTMTEEGYVDFPLSGRFEGEIEAKLGYGLAVRIHSSPTTLTTEYGEVLSSQTLTGEIVPQE